MYHLELLLSVHHWNFVECDVKHFKMNQSKAMYSSSHIVQITDFFWFEFLHEYFKEKSETYTKFETSFVETKN